MPTKINVIYFISVFMLTIGCKKEVIVEQTLIPSYTEVPTVLVENYINRIYIDLLGREPLDIEMINDVKYLRAGDLSLTTRNNLIIKLQTDTSYHEGEISYKHMYYHQIYDKCKARMLEGASEFEIQFEVNELTRSIKKDTAEGNYEAAQLKIYERQKLRDVLAAESLYMNDSITIGEMMGSMANNMIYDVINMNTFNFLRASFDNLFFRFPTDHEFYTCFDIVEYNKSGTLWGRAAQNKAEIINLWVTSKEFLNGQVTWLYQSLLSRNPTTAEMAYGMTVQYQGGSIQELERSIMITDEYAHFTYNNK